jgi:hydrogen peroxide-dependent heme synthase
MATDFESINNTIRYTNWTTFRAQSSVEHPDEAANSVVDFVDRMADHGVEIRGLYDIRGFRGDADLMMWSIAPEPEGIQNSLRDFGRSSFGQNFQSTWSGMGIHRPAEFNKRHVPGFMLDKEPGQWLCFYPFVRSYDWYLLPEAERQAMLVEHGKAGSQFPSIISSTVASFGLGDYEWLLALESDQLHDIVDMMRDLRYTKARLHVREEVPFFTGRRITVTQIGDLYR